MKIFIKERYIDFEAPIYMSEGQRKKFIEGMERIFSEKVKVENIVENKKEMGDITRHWKKFTEEDKIILANPDLSNEEIAEKMGKTTFAIQMRRGHFLMELQDWAKKKGKSKITEKDIREFLGEKK